MTRETPTTPVTSDLFIDAIEALSEGIAVFDADDRLVVTNERYRQMLSAVDDLLVPGVHWEDLVNACLDRGVYPTTKGGSDAWLMDARRTMHSDQPELEIEQSDGRVYRLSYNITRNGGFVVTREDITERRRAEAMVRDREALLTTILDTNPTPVVMARLRDSKIIYRSPAAFRTFGDAEYAGTFYVDPDGREAYIAALNRTGRVQDLEMPVRVADGREITVSISGGLTDYNGETCVVSTVTDMTEQLERDALIRKVVESCPAPILMNRAATGEILFKSPDIGALFGAIDSAADFYVKPSDRIAFLKELRKKGEVIEYRSRFRNAKGVPFWGAISARLINWDGEEVIVSHSRDLTEQLAIEGELGRQREQMFENEKMSALGGLLAGVAHELNNPLSVVVGHAMMLQDATDDPDILRQTAKISEAAERCSSIVRTFLSMARQSPIKMAPTDINQIVEVAVEVSRYGEAAGEATVLTDLAEGLPEICVDPDQITQVVLNLVLNAEQAIEGAQKGDTIRVSTRLGQHDREVLISVEDNGPGIRPDIRGRVFEPFFSTQGVGKGTGIGLSVCHRIMKAHGGEIGVSDVLPHGARFEVRLPCNAENVAVPHPETQSPKDEAGAALNVLVIDDEQDVADLNAEVLVRGGFKATATYSAEDAIDLLKEQSFDVVISDLNMPHLDGRGIFEVIKSRFADLAPHTGFITGDTMGRASQVFLRDSRRPFLEKPVAPRELRAFAAQLGKTEDL